MLRQFVPQLTLVPYREEHHLSLGVRIQDDMASQHQFSQAGLTHCLGKFSCLLSLKLPPTRPGIKKSSGSTACGCE